MSLWRSSLFSIEAYTIQVVLLRVGYEPATFGVARKMSNQLSHRVARLCKSPNFSRSIFHVFSLSFLYDFRLFANELIKEISLNCSKICICYIKKRQRSNWNNFASTSGTDIELIRERTEAKISCTAVSLKSPHLPTWWIHISPVQKRLDKRSGKYWKMWELN